jgi:hypothetical protein
MQKASVFFNEIETEVGKKNRTVYNLHAFYDFETCRGEEIKKNQFRHEVFSWAIKTMILDTDTKEYLIEHKLIENLMEKLISANRKDVRVTINDQRLLITGRSLKTFIQICKTIPHDDPTYVIKPTLWAHNGSKVSG